MTLNEPVGAILTLWRFPVKSMLGEELDAVDVSEGGIFGDPALMPSGTGCSAPRQSRATHPHSVGLTNRHKRVRAVGAEPGRYKGESSSWPSGAGSHAGRFRGAWAVDDRSGPAIRTLVARPRVRGYDQMGRGAPEGLGCSRVVAGSAGGC